ncbi:MAG: type I-U CRISPR-associated protein Cas7 [Alphaproteobacteria bacterium]|nr:type I-U CRISPR-associated protein Cas7 [Alphaproteobacteria bacterium]
MPDTLSFETLSAAVASAAAVRAVTRLQPAGGPGDKLFPPTYAVDDAADTRYAFEERVLDGQPVTCVLLDSVASQANRMEEALFDAWEDGELAFPVVLVDFTEEPGLADLDRVSALHAPHRIADALLRDSLLDGVPFRKSPLGQAFTDARVRHATAMYQACPTALIFGVWDSTGPKGGLGAKFQRALVSEIVGVHAQDGVKVSSRIDPAAIQRGVAVYTDKDDPSDWTIEGAQAKTDGKGNPEPFSRKGSEGKGRPSAINHGNIAPSIDPKAGGVTVDHALQTTVLSLPALRRLRFQDDCAGNPLPREARKAAAHAAHTALAALALAAVVHARSRGFDLRSRSLLVPEGPFELEVLPADGGAPVRYTLTPAQANALVERANAAATAAGMGWTAEPVVLRPAPKLADLIRASRDLAADADDDA